MGAIISPMTKFLGSPIGSVIVRSVRVYLQGLLGFLIAGQSGAAVLEYGDFLHRLGFAASLAVAPAVVSFVQNLVELFTKLDEKQPQLRG